jgi:glycosyltransferase involved in cell wall biosynthesis
MLPNRELVDALPEHDVFVLPTRVEGFPVALLEAMGAGLVPVVNDIPSGVPELVTAGETGFLPAVGDIAAAVESIRCLSADREMLNDMSRRCRAVVEQRYDIRQRVRDYQKLFAQYEQWRQARPARVTMPYGSRLDQRWLPNVLVYQLRRLQKYLARKIVSRWT